MIDNGNFVSRFIENAEKTPDKIALQLPEMDGQLCTGEESISYGELSSLVGAYQQLWQGKGWQAGDRVIVILKPSKDLYAIALSLFSMGIIAVFIDTGMGRKKIQMAIQDSNAKAIISLSALVKLFWFIPALWPLQRFAVDGQGLGYKNLSQQVSAIDVAQPSNPIPRSTSDHGLISFTSGSTGRPKGADRTHFSLIQQHLAIRDHWPDEIDDIDCPCFPVMVLHNLSCGMTTIMPKVDLAQPAAVDAKVVIEQIRQHNITRLSGAPAYITGLVSYLQQQDNGQQVVGEIKSIVVGGATVSVALAEGIRKAFPNADARIVYGSTEAEPISDVSIDEYLKASSQTGDSLLGASNLGASNPGYLVGKVASQIELLITNINESELTEGALLRNSCKAGEIGEILVSGDHVLKQYIDNPSANRENKIPRENVTATKAIWHRTGDCGYIDEQGRLWLTGRVKDVIAFQNTHLQPYPIEKSLDQLPGIVRSAMIQHVDQLTVFMQENTQGTSVLEREVRHILSEHLSSTGLDNIQLITLGHMPVDGRHNSKIDRPLLREYLEKGLQASVIKTNVIKINDVHLLSL